MKTFDKLGLNEKLVKGLAKQNITEPTKVQSLTIEKIIENKDLQIIKEVDKSFKLSQQYDEAVRRANIEKGELKLKYDGVSILEKYHSMTKEQQKAYLKA